MCKRKKGDDRMSDKDVTSEIVGGKIRYIERSVEDIPYFKGVKKFKYSGETSSNFFVFQDDVTLLTLKQRWNWKKYLKGLFRLSFGKTNGYDFYFEKQTFSGVVATNIQLNFGEGLKSADSETVEYLSKNVTKRKPAKAYVLLNAKIKEYDFVLGELSPDGTKVVKVHRVKKLHDKQLITILKDSIVDLGAQKIRTKIVTVL